MKTIQINKAVWKESEYFVAQCLNIDVPGFWDTREEALSNLQGALELYVKDSEHPKVTIIEKVKIAGAVLSYA